MSSVVVLGGTGFVGSALVARLAAGGHRVRVLTRGVERAKHLSVLPNVEIVVANVHQPLLLSREFAGCEIVVNLIGILNESGRSGRGFELAHAELARKIVDAAGGQGVRRLLHMSSLRADAAAPPSHYLRSKGIAERHVRAAAATLDYTIFRPSVIFGPGDSLLNRFAGLLRLSGGWLPLAKPDARFQPVFVGDVVEAFMRALGGGATSRQSYDLGGPEIVTLQQLVEFTGEMIAVPAKILRLPDAIARVQAFVMDFLPGKPFSTDNYRSLTLDSVCAENGFARLGIVPSSLRAIVPGYLGPQTSEARLDRFRAAARRTDS